MKITIYNNSLSRDFIKCEDFLASTKCIQQSNKDVADNDGKDFLKPMADFIAHTIVNDFLK